MTLIFLEKNKNMLTNKWVFLILSAMIYALPFIFVKELWLLEFIFLIPLFYAILIYHISFKEGFVWGLVSSIVILNCFFDSNFIVNNKHIFIKILPVLFCTIYIAFVSALVFFLAAQIDNFLKKRYITIFIWIFFIWILFYIYNNLLLFPLSSVKEGFFIFDPLLPLAYKPQFIYLASYIGKNLFIFLIIIFSSCIALIFNNNKILWPKITVFGIIILLSSTFFYHSNKIFPKWIDKVAYLPTYSDEYLFANDIEEYIKYHPKNREIGNLLSYDVNINLFNELQKINNLGLFVGEKLKKTIEINPNIEIVLIPERAFYCDFSKNLDLLENWSKQNIGRSINILCGATRFDKNFYNTVYLINNGKLVSYFDKRHALFPAEKIQTISQNLNLILNKLYFKPYYPYLDISSKVRPNWKLTDNIIITPYICSELFFNNDPDDNSNYPIIALCKDRWVKSDYLRSLLFLHVKMKAILWKRTIIYVNYNQAFVFNESGEFKQILKAN